MRQRTIVVPEDRDTKLCKLAESLGITPEEHIARFLQDKGYWVKVESKLACRFKLHGKEARALAKKIEGFCRDREESDPGCDLSTIKRKIAEYAEEGDLRSLQEMFETRPWLLTKETNGA